MNIQAYIRVRPLGAKETRSNRLEFKNKEVNIKTDGRSGKTLTFDRVFDETTEQACVYNVVVKPMIKKVLQGYNCTVFAYGQTGTGKTYTMSGKQGIPDEQNVHAGIIPRAMEDIFIELKKLTCDHEVSVSYIELYNEKLRSLLHNQDIDDFNIQLLDNTEGGVTLKGLLPTHVKNKSEVYKLLEQGAEKRQMAATSMNVNSSRSHTIFTIDVNITENMLRDGSDVVRVGKLHLVDLAGSENVTRSGANDTINRNRLTGVNRRLTESSNINRSLLTLGRVITSITENNNHIPYRESKLTRLLRDSLGGKTNTCIIGTISPAQSSLDETENTLNYTYKARSIKNNPEINNKISRKELIQVLTLEIAKLKQELRCQRQNDSFYISTETYEDMVHRKEQLIEELKAYDDRYIQLQLSFEAQEVLFERLKSDNEKKRSEYQELKQMFNSESEAYKKECNELSKEITLREYFIKEYKNTESKLTCQTKACNSVIETLLEENDLLHDKIERQQAVENSNLQTLEGYKQKIETKIVNLCNNLESFNQFKEEVHSEASRFSKSLLDEMHEKNEQSVSSIRELLEKIDEFNCVTEECAKTLGNKTKEVIQSSSVLHEKFKEERCKCVQKMSEHVQTAINLIDLEIIKLQDTFKKKEEIDKVVKAKRLELKEQLDSNVEKFEDAQKTIREGLNAYREQIKITIEKADEAEKKAFLLSEKAKQIADAALELEVLTNELQETTSVAEANIINSIDNTDGVKKIVVNEIGKCQVAVASSAQGVFRRGDECQFYENDIPNQVNHIADTIAKVVENELIVCNMKSEFGVFSNNVKGFTKSYEEIVQAGVNLCVTYSDDFKDVTRNFQTNEEDIFNKIENNLSDFKKSSEKSLRENHNKFHSHVETVKMEKSKSTSDLKNFIKEANLYSYMLEVPLGITPKKVPMDELNFPREFASTSARDVLTQRFLDSQGRKSDPGSRTTNSAASSCVSPASDLDISEVSKAREEFHSTRTLRQSLSLPNITGDDLLLLPSTDENKENVAIVKSGTKSKKKKTTKHKRC